MPARLRDFYEDREGTEFNPMEEPIDIFPSPMIDPSQLRAGELVVPIKMVFGDLQSRRFIEGQQGWKIDYEGNAEFNNVTVRGVIESTSGEIAGFIIDGNEIKKNNFVLDSSGTMVLGSSNDVVALSSVDATYRMWVGHAAAGSAPFSITKDGVMKATDGDFAGSVTVGGDDNVKIDGTNDRILISDGTNDRVLIGKF